MVRRPHANLVLPHSRKTMIFPLKMTGIIAQGPRPVVQTLKVSIPLTDLVNSTEELPGFTAGTREYAVERIERWLKSKGYH